VSLENFIKMSPINRDSHIVNKNNKIYIEKKLMKSSLMKIKKYTKSKVANLLKKDRINSSKHQKPTQDITVMSVKDTCTIVPAKRVSLPTKFNKLSANVNQQKDQQSTSSSTKKGKDALKDKSKSSKKMKYQPRAWIISSADIRTAFTPNQNKPSPVKHHSSPTSVSQNNKFLSSAYDQRAERKVDRPTTHKQHVHVNSTYHQKVQILLFPAAVNKQKQIAHNEDKHLASKYDQRPQKVRITFKEYRERKQKLGSYKQPPKVNRLIMPSMFTPLVIDTKLGVATTQKRTAKRSFYDDNDLMDTLSFQKKRKLD